MGKSGRGNGKNAATHEMKHKTERFPSIGLPGIYSVLRIAIFSVEVAPHSFWQIKLQSIMKESDMFHFMGNLHLICCSKVQLE